MTQNVTKLTKKTITFSFSPVLFYENWGFAWHTGKLKKKIKERRFSHDEIGTVPSLFEAHSRWRFIIDSL